MVLFAQNNKGFSLIEMIVALVILMISMLGLSSVMVNSINANANNEIRNTALRLTNQTAEALFSLPFNDTEVTAGNHARDDASVAQDSEGFPRRNQRVRETLNQTYNISWAVADTSVSLKTITINVTTTFGYETFSNEAVIYKHTSL